MKKTVKLFHVCVDERPNLTVFVQAVPMQLWHKVACAICCTKKANQRCEFWFACQAWGDCKNYPKQKHSRYIFLENQFLQETLTGFYDSESLASHGFAGKTANPWRAKPNPYVRSTST